MSTKHTPQARKTDLEVAPLPEETVVYDRRTDKAHCLNQTAALVWENCNGRNEPRDIAQLVGASLSAPVPVDVVSLAIAELAKAGLLEPEMAAQAKGPSRREVIRRTAGIAVALPLISTLLAPTAASASSTCGCVNPGNCLTQTTCPSTVNCNGSGICAP